MNNHAQKQPHTYISVIRLRYLHNNKAVHCNIRPEKLLYTDAKSERGKAKLTDLTHVWLV